MWNKYYNLTFSYKYELGSDQKFHRPMVLVEKEEWKLKYFETTENMEEVKLGRQICLGQKIPLELWDRDYI